MVLGVVAVSYERGTPVALSHDFVPRDDETARRFLGLKSKSVNFKINLSIFDVESISQPESGRARGVPRS